MSTRRQFAVRAAVLAVSLSACSARSSPDSGPVAGTVGERSSGSDAAEATRTSDDDVVRVETPLGTVVLTSAASSSSAWVARTREAAARVAGEWGRAPGTIRLTVLMSQARFDALGDSSDAHLAAVTNRHGIIVGPRVETSLTSTGKTVVIAHELVHARLGHFGADRTATWLKEGAAEWTAQHELQMPRVRLWPTLAAAFGTDPDRFGGPPRESEFDADAHLAYEWAAAYVTYLVHVCGRQRVLTLVRSRAEEARAERGATALVPASAPGFDTWLADTLR